MNMIGISAVVVALLIVVVGFEGAEVFAASNFLVAAQSYVMLALMSALCGLLIAHSAKRGVFARPINPLLTSIGGLLFGAYFLAEDFAALSPFIGAGILMLAFAFIVAGGIMWKIEWKM